MGVEMIQASTSGFRIVHACKLIRVSYRGPGKVAPAALSINTEMRRSEKRQADRYLLGRWLGKRMSRQNTGGKAVLPAD